MSVVTIIGHLSFVAIAASFMIRDIVWLRTLAILGSVFAVIFNYFVSGGPIWLVIGWSIVFIALNVYNIAFLMHERRGVSFTPQEQEMYETVFQGFSPVEFMKLLRIGNWRDATAGQDLIEEGQQVDEVLYIYNGRADVLSGGQRINILKDGAFIGEMELAADRPAVATVRTTAPTQIMAWPANEIRKLLIRNPSMNSTIQTIFGADLMQKLERQSSAVLQG
jgi:hypothetical protein